MKRGGAAASSGLLQACYKPGAGSVARVGRDAPPVMASETQAKHDARRGAAAGLAARLAPRGLGERGAAVSVGVLGALFLGVLSAVLPREPTPRGDDLIYEDMARHPFAVHTFPFGYRLGLPLLVHVMPFGHTTSFLLLAWLAAGGAAAFAYLLMRELGADTRVAVGLALLLSVSPPFLVVALRQGRNPDIATVFFMMAATYFAVRRLYWQLAVTLLVGVLFREAVLFIVPLAYAIWAARPLERAAALRTLLVAAPAVAGYIAIRLGIHTIDKEQVPGYSGSLVGERFEVLKLGLQTPFREARRMFTVYGPLWLVAPVALPTMRFARRGLVLVALSVAAMTFALDWGRMILLAAPVFYAASGFVLTRKPRWTVPVFAAFLALVLGYAVYMGVSGVKNGITDAPAPPYAVR